MKNLLVVSLVLVAAACSKKEGAASSAPAGDECGAVLAHMESLQGDMLKDAPAEQKDSMKTMLTNVTKALVQSCRDTKWSKDATDCMKAMKSMEDSKACEDKLTKEQKEAADKAASAAVGMDKK